MKLVVAAGAVAVLTAGCSAEIVTGAAVPGSEVTVGESAVPATDTEPMTFLGYLESQRVDVIPVPPASVDGLNLVVPVPDGWERFNDPEFDEDIDFIRTIGDRSALPSALLITFRLVGDIDPDSAIEYANTDALPYNATDVTTSVAPHHGFPSATATGTADGIEYFSRFTIATAPSTGARYLIQLALRTPADEPIGASPALTSIVDGFAVTAP